ncbi:MAG: beta-ketoacyl synthase chain length factor [Bacteroidota bacterium]
MDEDIEQLKPSVDNKLFAIEPLYENIPPGLLRRMGKAVRMGVGAALPLTLQAPNLAGIVIGTSNGGMEDCIKFLNQIIDYEEGRLTPTNFVQSTTNAIASQIGLLSTNKGYNVTHVHRGVAFENAMLDITMLIKENPSYSYLLGGLDEISSFNYNIDFCHSIILSRPSTVRNQFSW